MRAPADMRAEVMSALDRVIDPCSVGRHLPAGLVEMGMVESVRLVEGETGCSDVEIELQLTSPACHFQHWFGERVETEVSLVEGVRAVSVSWSRAFDWSDEKMSPSLKARIREKRLAARGARSSGVGAAVAEREVKHG